MCRFRLLLALLVPLCLIHSPSLGADPSGRPINDKPIVLSPFEVVASTVEFKHWIKLSSPHYILYTDAGEKEAMLILRHSEMLRKAAEVFFRRPALQLGPTILVLPTSSSDWRKIAAKGIVQWKAGTTEHDRVTPIIIVEYDWDGDGVETLLSAEAVTELRALNLDGPLWFTYGTGKFFGAAEFADDVIKVGQPTAEIYALRDDRWLPWPDFFGATMRSPEFTHEALIHRFSAQSSLFVQYMLTNKDPVWTTRLLIWNSLLKAGNSPTEPAFKDVFGQDWPAWRSTLEHYMMDGEYVLKVIKMTPAEAKCQVIKHELRTVEMRDLFVLCQVLNQHIPASEQTLDSLLANGLKTKSLRGLLALACLSHRRNPPALAVLQELIAEDSKNPDVYATAANLLFDRHVKKRSIRASLGDDQAQIEAWVRKAVELEPRYADANELLSWTLALAPQVDAAKIKEIKGVYDRLTGAIPTSPLVAALATAYWRAGNAPFARRLAEVVDKSPYSLPADRTVAHELLEVTAPAAPPPATKS